MKGNLLISKPSLLNDSIFYKSIIIIVDDTINGSTGFIVNRQLDLYITKNVDSSKKTKINLYFGGPVSTNYFYLLRSKISYPENINIQNDLYWGNNIEFLLKKIKRQLIKLDDVILLQGYSGWSTDQLSYEINNNSWIVLKDRSETVFSLKEKNSWNNLIRSLGDEYRIWSDSPDDLSLN